MSKSTNLFISCVILMIAQHVSLQKVEERPRIINGILASDLAFIASIHITYASSEIRICVGSIVSEYLVLTSATCLSGLPNEEWKGFVRIGSLKLLDGGVTHDFIKMLQHPEFNPETHENDLLLLEVKGPMVYNNFVREAHIDFTKIMGGARVAVAGWGASKADDLNTPSQELMFISDVTINWLECQTKLSNQNFNVTVDLADGICIAGMPGGSLCNFDYGAPLLHEDKIIGVWSWGPPQCEGDFPYVFTMISPHINWIAKYRGKKLG